MNYAVYRVLYGAEFIEESIESIASHMDKIFVFWTDIPWGNVTHVTYKGQVYKIPEVIDSIKETLERIQVEKYLDKLVLLYDCRSDNMNQFTELVNNRILPVFEKPDKILFIEPDHVFREDDLVRFLSTEFPIGGFFHASSNQVELWKSYLYRIPERDRYGAVLWDLSKLDRIPKTFRHANSCVKIPVIKNARVHNFGFCMDDHTMFYKFLVALGYSEKIGDSVPSEAWFDRWKNWSLNRGNSNLEISRGAEYLIPYAYCYENYKAELPEPILRKYNIKPL